MTSNQFFLAQLHERSHGQYVKKWSGLYSNKAFLQKQICGLQLDRAQWATVSKIYLLSELWKVGRKEARQGTLGGSIFLSQGIQRAMQEISLVREGNGTPLQYSCLENPMDGGAWQAVVHGVARSRTRLSDFTFTFHFSLSCTGEGNGNPLSVLAWRIPGTGEPGGLLSLGSHRVGHD